MPRLNETHQYIRIGMPASLSGQYRAQGAQALNGARAWVDHTNSGGGIQVASRDRRLLVSLIYYDDQSSVLRVRELTQHLVDGRVDLLLGPYSSVLSLAAA